MEWGGYGIGGVGVGGWGVEDVNEVEGDGKGEVGVLIIVGGE